MRREVKTFDKRRSKGQPRDLVHSLCWWKVSRVLDLGTLKAPSKQQYRAAALKFASFDPTADNMWQKVKMSSVVLKVKTTHDWVHVCRVGKNGWGRSQVSCDKLDRNVNVTGHNRRGRDMLWNLGNLTFNFIDVVSVKLPRKFYSATARAPALRNSSQALRWA